MGKKIIVVRIIVGRGSNFIIMVVFVRMVKRMEIINFIRAAVLLNYQWIKYAKLATITCRLRHQVIIMKLQLLSPMVELIWFQMLRKRFLNQRSIRHLVQSQAAIFTDRVALV
jgi:hypothetical protein